MKIKTFDYDNQPDNVIICDWREDPKNVMAEVNSILSKFNLEVIKYETTDDSYIFAINKK